MSTLDRPEVTIFPDAAAFRRWLERHHATAGELWIGYYKKGVPKTSMTYAEAVDEALCFGWIDGLTRRVDDEVTSQRFTPRRPTSNWSAINIAKVGRLTDEGRMHPAGLRAFENRDRRQGCTVLLRTSPARAVRCVPPPPRGRRRSTASLGVRDEGLPAPGG